MDRLTGKNRDRDGRQLGHRRGDRRAVRRGRARASCSSPAAPRSWRRSPRGSRPRAGPPLALPADVTRVEDCRRVCAETARTFGRIDVLVNNAGIVDQHTPTIRTTDELWDTVIAVNLTGTFSFCREALEYMTRAEAGSIVNVSSIAGAYGNGGAAYSASKYGVVGLTKNIAIQYAGTAIRCNAVCPGPTPTELNTPEQLERFDAEFMGICARHTDLSVGVSDPADQAEAILYLASDAARYVTGQVLVVDRGMCL